MKKKVLLGIFTLMLGLVLTGCGSKGTDNKKNNINNENKTQEVKQEANKNSTSWPSNTIFPKPEGCSIQEVKQETNGFYYITVKWDNKEAAKNYIEKIKEAEGDSAEVIGSGETEETIYYGTYSITITSMNEEYNIVLYK